MFVTINGCRLFFDVEGPKLAMDGPTFREKPTLLLLHGGPGGDHSLFRLRHGRFADIAQVIYLDQRGMGRSDRPPAETLTLAQWGADVKAFCDALGIEKPIVLGHSFGGYVAQSYATRFPDHPATLILDATIARFDLEASVRAFTRLGGEKAGAAARAYFTTPGAEHVGPLVEHGFPLYWASPEPDTNAAARILWNTQVAHAFFQDEGKTFDFSDDLRGISCPTLIVSCALDPIHPPELQDHLHACFTPGVAELLRLERSAHHVTDEWPLYEQALRGFIQTHAL